MYLIPFLTKLIKLSKTDELILQNLTILRNVNTVNSKRHAAFRREWDKFENMTLLNIKQYLYFFLYKKMIFKVDR